MKNSFDPTHFVVKDMPGLFSFHKGTYLQHIEDGYYKDRLGNMRAVDPEYLKEINPLEMP